MTTIQFNQYPALKPDETGLYLVLFPDGTTDACWFWSSSNKWSFDNDNAEKANGVTAWANFPVVKEAPQPWYYVLIVWEDIEPELIGPFQTPEERNERARKLRAEHGPDHGVYPVESAGVVTIDSYTGIFFEE